MKTMYQFKCRTERVTEAGERKNVTETYLVDALSFTEAETRATEMARSGYADFEIKDIRQVHYSDVCGEEDGTLYYRAKVLYATLDERTGAQRLVASYKLVRASSLEEAVDELHRYMQDTLSDWQLVSIAETPIKGYYRYN